jgi:hypothetical protein
MADAVMNEPALMGRKGPALLFGGRSLDRPARHHPDQVGAVFGAAVDIAI